MYVSREYSFSGSTSSQATPMTMQMAESRGVSLSTRRSLRSARSVAGTRQPGSDSNLSLTRTHLSRPWLPRRGVAALPQGCGLHAASRGIVTSAKPPGHFFDDVHPDAHFSATEATFLTSNSPVAVQTDAQETTYGANLASSLPDTDTMPSFPQFNPLRLRSYVLRLPLCTRLLLTAMVGLWAATIPFKGLRDFACLEPDKVNLGTSE